MTSFNHFALGSVADWMHRVIGGLSPAAPGYRRIEWAPQPGGGLDHARVAFDSPYGLIEGSWERVADGIRYALRVPTGVEGTVVVPGIEPQHLESGGHFEVTVAASAALAA
jgi:alpha-L-rhamnosidase